MKIVLIVLIIPFLFSFVDPKIGGTFEVTKSFKFSAKEYLTAEVTLIKNGQVIAKNIVTNVIFPQAFVITPKHALDGKQAQMTGSFDALFVLVDAKSNKKYFPSKKFVNIPLGVKDLTVIFDQERP